jgi:hypothetical protein
MSSVFIVVSVVKPHLPLPAVKIQRVRKFFRIRIPSLVKIDSGWN